MIDESPTSKTTLERRIGGRIRVPDGAQLSFAERRPFRRVRRITTDVDVVDLSVTGVAVRVLGDHRFCQGDVLQLLFRGARGTVVVRHVGDPSTSGSRVYGLEVPESSGPLFRELSAAIGAKREDLQWRWEVSG